MYAQLFYIAVLLLGVCTGEDLDELIKSIRLTNEQQPKMDLNSLNGLINTIFNTSLGLPNQDIPGDETTTPRTPTRSCALGSECVREYLCSSGHTNTDGAKLFNVRLGLDEPRDCPFLETCCSLDDVVTEPIIRKIETPTGCGYRNIDGVGFKIEGGTTESEFGEFPWMLAILLGSKGSDENYNIYRCGGSLIHPRVALTSAHCVDDRPATDFKVRAGEWETNTKTELYPHQDRQAVDMVIHENYNKDNLQFDIALLFLESPFDLAPNVNTICLPSAGFYSDFSLCYAAGWGKDKFQNGRYQNILKKVELPVVPNYVCQDNLRKTHLGRHFKLHWSFMCAGGEDGKDTCEGDGGSPLVCPVDNEKDRYYQAGIVAWGIGCGQKNVPGVYANVSQFRRWIDEQFTNRKIDNSSFTMKVFGGDLKR